MTTEWPSESSEWWPTFDVEAGLRDDCSGKLVDEVIQKPQRDTGITSIYASRTLFGLGMLERYHRAERRPSASTNSISRIISTP